MEVIFLRATGIVRRIDDLGRVVIPKELRQTMRIREGEPLEIFTSGDGDVVFRKYSTVGEISGFAAKYAQVLYGALKLPVLICDRDAVCAAHPAKKKELVGKRLSDQLDKSLNKRETTISDEGIFCLNDYKERACVVSPIQSGGDVVGCIAVLRTAEDSAPLSEKDLFIVETATKLLGAQTEE